MRDVRTFHHADTACPESTHPGPHAGRRGWMQRRRDPFGIKRELTRVAHTSALSGRAGCQRAGKGPAHLDAGTGLGFADLDLVRETGDHGERKARRHLGPVALGGYVHAPVIAGGVVAGPRPLPAGVDDLNFETARLA